MPEDRAAPTEKQHASSTSTDRIGLIRMSDGTEVSCTVENLSKAGARIGLPANVELPNEFMLKVVGMDYVCSVELVWRGASLAGVRILQLAKLPPKPAAPLTLAERAAAADRTPHRSLGTRRGLRRG